MKVALQSYDRLHRAEPELWQPRTVAELAALLRRARDQGRRATLRAGGCSFHDQALNDDLVISLSKLDRIVEVDPMAQTISVEAGATWGAIVDAALEHDLVPYVVVSTSHATAGGTMASDGISRFSPSYGSESAHIVSFDLLCVGEDEPRTIVAPEPDQIGGDADVFRAVVGGFGMLGAVTRITYRLLSTRALAGHGPLQVVTRLTTARSWADLVDEQLLPACEACGAFGTHLEQRHFAAGADEHTLGVYAIAFLHAGGAHGAVYRSRYTRDHCARPYLVFQPRYWLRVVLGFLAGFAWIHRIGSRIAWWFIERDARAQTSFINDAVDFTFFMDANVRKKQLGESLGLAMPVIQQTFVVPVRGTAAFLDAAARRLADTGLAPTLIDILFMPEDRILMSASNGLQGFACTFSFEDVRQDEEVATVIAALESLSELCLLCHGRVHFTKNVHARPETLRAMYGPQLTALMAIEAALDPDGVLRNGFYDRVFAAPAELQREAGGGELNESAKAAVRGRRAM